MITIEYGETYGWEAAVRGMRNPKNSWNRSDSIFAEGHTELGENDLELMRLLANAGPDHGKFLRMIGVSCDITGPLYWWKEMDTYKVGTVADSCSTMHRIAAKEFEFDDFSHEKLIKSACMGIQEQNIYRSPTQVLAVTIGCLNSYRELYLQTKDKKYWWQMIQLLPSSYNQKRTWTANYAVLRNIYRARKDHKLDEWHTFCDWIELLPYSELITGEENYNGKPEE